MQAFDGFNIVLCRAMEPGNVGAVCRAMKTMGFRNLALADCPEYPEEPVKTFALHAYDVYQSARRFPGLESALKECALTAGFTRRTGRMRTRKPMDVEEFSRLAMDRQGPLALVFGNERDGLSRDELALCDMAVRIPTSDAFPSLNLAQAVQIACWELSRNQRGRGGGSLREPECPESVPVGRTRLEEAVDGLADDLALVGFFKIAGRAGFLRFSRSLLARAAVDARELDYFLSIFRKAASLPGRRNPTTLTSVASEARVSEEIPATNAPEGDRLCND